QFLSPPGNTSVNCGQIPAPTCLSYTNGGSGNCLISGCVTSTQTAAPGVCGGVVTETWTFTDQCQRTITHTRTITVNPAAQAQFAAAENINAACGQIPPPSCLNYTNGGSGGCLISGCATSTQTNPPGACGGVV